MIYTNDMEIQEETKISFSLINNGEGIEGNAKVFIENFFCIDTITCEIYREIFQAVTEHHMQLCFVRHYVPRINSYLSDEYKTTYELFNKGRYRAYEDEFGTDKNKWHIPAASAVGNREDYLEISFKATKGNIRVLENKCQVPAYAYSKKYGTYPPVFSRASIIEENETRAMLASGTASIVGENSQYHNLYDQLYKTIENLRILGSQFNLKLYGLEDSFAVEDIRELMVFYRQENDLAFLKQIVPKYVAPHCTIAYEHANICRKELLVELEAVFAKKGNEKANANKYILKDNRIVTESFEIHVCEHCNLKCEECCNISPMNSEMYISSNQIKILCDFLKTNIKPDVIKLSGGEPLLHPELETITKTIKNNFPKTTLRITSNGLLAQRLTPDICKHIDQLWISNYKSAPVPEKNVNFIKEMARTYGFIYNIKHVDQFNKIFPEEPVSDKNKVQQTYDECWMKHRCALVRNNTFFKCTRAAYIDDLLSKITGVKKEIATKDGISIGGDNFKEKALTYLNSKIPLQSCTYCLGSSGKLIENKQKK